MPSPQKDSEFIIAGTDDAGRGSFTEQDLWFVFAAAVILNPGKPIPRLTDSKKLLLIITNCLTHAIAQAEMDEIDRLDILRASLLAIQRARLLNYLFIKLDKVLVDGNCCPDLPSETEAIIQDNAHTVSFLYLPLKQSRT